MLRETKAASASNALQKTSHSISESETRTTETASHGLKPRRQPRQPSDPNGLAQRCRWRPRVAEASWWRPPSRRRFSWRKMTRSSNPRESGRLWLGFFTKWAYTITLCPQMIRTGHVNFYTDDEWIQMGTVNGQPIFRRTGSEMMRTKMTSLGGCKQPAVQDMPQQSHVRSFLVVNLVRFSKQSPNWYPITSPNLT